jgi:hypothetical protein
MPIPVPHAVEILSAARQLDFMVALGTHPAIPEEGLLHLVGITAQERAGAYRQVGLLNHPGTTRLPWPSLGVMEADEIRTSPRLLAQLPARRVDIRINQLALEYDTS